MLSSDLNEATVYFIFSFEVKLRVMSREQGPLLPPGISDKYGRQPSDYCKGVRLTAQITKAHENVI